MLVVERDDPSGRSGPGRSIYEHVRREQGRGPPTGGRALHPGKSGDKVVARVRFRGTHRGELDGIAPTGRRVDCSGIVVSRMEGGKIAEDWANFDDLGMMRQLGVLPESGEQPTSSR
jgi:hypothetical protein